MGARPDKDGLSATSFPCNIAMTPIEMLESVTGIFVERKGLRPDSGGPGRCRGGLGQDMVFTVDAGCSYLCVGPTGADPEQIDVLATDVLPELR